MKNIILTLTLFLSFLTLGQIAPPKRQFKLSFATPPSAQVSSFPVGPGMLMGGTAFFVAGILTPPTMVGGSTTEKKPFIQQGPRALAMITGGIVFTIGIGITIGGF